MSDYLDLSALYEALRRNGGVLPQEEEKCLNRNQLSKELKRFVDKTLRPDPKWEKAGKKAADQVFTCLRRAECPFNVARVLIGGSVGKGTQVRQTDFDLVVFLNDVEPPFDIGMIERMERWIKGLHGYKQIRMNRFTVTFELEVSGYTLKMDLCPAANLLSNNRLQAIGNGSAYGLTSSEQAKQVRRRLKQYDQKYNARMGTFYSTSLAEQTVLFLRARPQPVKDVIKLAKYWNDQIVMDCPPVRGRSYMIELIAVRSQQKRPPCSLAQRFVRFLEMMKKFGRLKVVFGFHYNKTSVPDDIMKQRPLILDPCNPQNNIADRIREEAIEAWEYWAKKGLQQFKDGVYSVEDLLDVDNYEVTDDEEEDENDNECEYEDEDEDDDSDYYDDDESE